MISQTGRPFNIADLKVGVLFSVEEDAICILLSKINKKRYILFEGFNLTEGFYFTISDSVLTKSTLHSWTYLGE